MCGISGIVSLNSNKIALESLKRINNSIKHRGPDGEGYWLHEKGKIGFGHRRLSILDLSEKGKQPMTYANSRYKITFNGEIFNFIELRAFLKAKGYTFDSDTDTEVVLASYDFWGKDCLLHFNGMWAFAIWDEMEEEIFLSRDHFGIKPLYYLFQPNVRFVFGSETIQFRNLDGFNRVFDDVNLKECILNPYVQEGEGKTIYSEINSILPGHYIILKNGSINEVRWWNTMDYIIDIPNNYENQVERFRELYFESTKLRLRSDVPIGSALSGGIDSSSVYATIHHLNKFDRAEIERLPNEWSKAFVATFPNTDQDETFYAKAVINHIEGKGVFWEQQKGDLVSDILKYTKKFDAVYNTPIHVLSKIYELMRQSGIVVSMDGHGVDEMMFGYAGLQLDVALHALGMSDLDYSNDLIQTFANLFPEISYEIRLQEARFKVYGKKTHNNRFRTLINSIVTKKKSNWLNGGHSQRNSGFAFDETQFKVNYELEMYKQFHYSPLPAILRNFDKASMMNGIEIRMPFMDHRLVSFVFKLPIKSKLGNGYTKRILRDSMKGILPENVRTRKTKIGFSAPLKEWIDGPLKEYSLDTVHSTSFLNTNFWNGKQIAIDLEKYYKNKNKFDYQLFWSILNTHIINQE